jgi:enoyl-CoA hydratase
MNEREGLQHPHLSDLSYLRWEIRSHVLTAWMNRPPVNAVNQEMYRELRVFFTNLHILADSDDVRAVVLAGEGLHFCAGNDLHEFQSLSPDNSPSRMLEVREAFWAIYDCPLPVIAAVQGTAVGTGLAIASCCDFIVAARGARLGLPEIAVGVMGGARHLARLLPQPIVRWMFLSGEPMAVEELAAHGAVLIVVAPDELLEEAQRRARTIARHSPIAIRFAKRSLNDIEFTELKRGYEAEQSLTGELSGYHDSKEAISAFFERREPRYSGR